MPHSAINRDIFAQVETKKLGHKFHRALEEEYLPSIKHEQLQSLSKREEH